MNKGAELFKKICCLHREDINEIFRKVSWLDENRWTYIDNLKSLTINYASQEMNPHEKILTHFLCYISQRQMEFSQIWDKGGFVYSDLVNCYSRENRSPKELLNPAAKDSFLIQTEDTKGTKDTKTKDTQYTYSFVSKRTVPNNNLLLDNYDIKVGENLKYKSRFYTSDIKSIMQTLYLLDDQDYERNIIRFIATVVEKNIKTNPVKKVGFALHLLAFYNIGKPKSEKELFQKIEKEVESNKEQILDILQNDSKFEIKFEQFFGSKSNFKQKRMWCALRDYIKSPEFCKNIIEGFKEIKKDNLSEIWMNLDCSELELPGDVWNNNVKFKNCLFGNIYCDQELEEFRESSKKMKAPIFIRGIYEECKPEIGYPEMFDVTFDFVPRMCEKNMCDFCIFNKQNKISELCTQDESKYCPVLLVSCGYKNKCNKTSCVLLS